jgi:hypothetical protein
MVANFACGRVAIGTFVVRGILRRREGATALVMASFLRLDA